MIAQRLEEQLFRWLRAAELTCDRAALLVVQDPKVYTPKNPFKLDCVSFSSLLKAILIIILFSYHTPTRGGHLCADEVSWGLPVFG